MMPQKTVKYLNLLDFPPDYIWSQILLHCRVTQTFR